MPFVKIEKAGTGSVGGLADYLNKENENKSEQEQDHFFSHDAEGVPAQEVTNHVDSMRGQLGKDEEKQYQVIIAFSENELKGKTDEQLKEYSKEFMQKAYAENFTKGSESVGHNSENFVWYAKLEHERKYSGDDIEIKEGRAKSGQYKPGDQRHVHVVVSRKTADNKQKRSPLTNHQNTNRGRTTISFSRSNMKDKAEDLFDKKFNHSRTINDRWRTANILKNGTLEQRNAFAEKMGKSVAKGSIKKLEANANKMRQQQKNKEQTVKPGHTTKMGKAQNNDKSGGLNI